MTLLGFGAIAHSLVRLYRVPLEPQWLVLAALTLISGSVSVKLPRANVSISISEAFVFSAVLLYGPAAGSLTVALDSLVISFWIVRRHPEKLRALFNISAPVVSVWVSANLFFFTSGVKPLVERPASLNEILPSLVLFALAYFGLNSWLIAFMVAFQKRQSPMEIWGRGYAWLSLNYFCGASVAVLLVGNSRTIDLRFVAVTTPLLLVLYFTFKTSMERVEDANRHLEKLNSLYLSTIETLAMAIDAKDQITHGHVRRVQGYAMGLAKELGITEDTLIKAIEAASLLHDMGKLAVPEYILNKPGKLTAAEFDKMKLHTSVGADILSAIDFPYPVVPIVRYHHENWDGTGYPAGLRGTDIPIGARILSVVDCFDALTSDRPYRPRLSDHEAVKVLTERRGSMYDPLVVDTFINVYTTIAPKSDDLARSRQGLREIVSLSSTAPWSGGWARLEEITASTDEMLALHDLAATLAGQESFIGAADAIAKRLRRLIPASLCVLYSYERATDELEATYVVGDQKGPVSGLRVPLGQRVSGWVAANRQTILNSDPSLDLGDIARSADPRLCSCMSTPLLFEDQLLGVLTLYSTAPVGFNENHRRIIEAVARQVSSTLRRIADRVRRPSQALGHEVLTLAQLEQFVDTGKIGRAANGPELTLLLIDVVNPKQLHANYGNRIAQDILTHVAEQVGAVLRPDDLLFQYSSDRLVALLVGNDLQAGQQLADEVRHRIRGDQFALPSGEVLSLDISIICASAPRDRQSLSQLVGSTRTRRPGARRGSDSSVH